MADVITYVGLDVHQASIAVARLAGPGVAPEIWETPNDRAAARAHRCVENAGRFPQGPPAIDRRSFHIS